MSNNEATRALKPWLGAMNRFNTTIGALVIVLHSLASVTCCLLRHLSDMCFAYVVPIACDRRRGMAYNCTQKLGTRQSWSLAVQIQLSDALPLMPCHLLLTGMLAAVSYFGTETTLLLT